MPRIPKVILRDDSSIFSFSSSDSDDERPEVRTPPPVRSNAVRQTAKEMPISDGILTYDQFVLAQLDPEYAEFLKYFPPVPREPSPPPASDMQPSRLYDLPSAPNRKPLPPQ